MSESRLEPSWQRDYSTINNVWNVDPLAVIYNENQWRLSMVSPLNNFQYKSVKLKQYASKIRQDLGSSVALKSLENYTVHIEPQPLLKYCEDDSDGLMVSVSSNENNNTKLIYVSILLSWGISDQYDNATHLPYMLERGEQKVGVSVKTTLQHIFDCIIKQFTFTQYQLLQFGFYFIEGSISRSNDPFILTYKTGDGIKDKLDISFEVGDIQMIWNGMKDEVNNSELVKNTYNVLKVQIQFMISMDVSPLNLCEVRLPKAEVKNNGVIKMKTPEIVNAVFIVLNDILRISLYKDIENISLTLSNV